MKNSADLGGCYPPQPSASVDNTLLDLQNSSYPTQPHSIIAKYPPYFPTGTLTSIQAIFRRYNEVCDPGYSFGSGGFSSGTGHFTQVVWRGSTLLGIGRAEVQQSGMKCAYIVGRYKPAGNSGNYEQNVQKGSFDANSYCASVTNSGWKKKFLDKQGRAGVTISTKTSQLAQSESTGSAEVRAGQHLQVLKKKKTTVAKKHD